MTARPRRGYMKIEYLGHSCFFMTSGKCSYLTDPFSGIGYEMSPVAADYVTMSHDHFDHNYLKGVRGAKKVFIRAGEYHAGDVLIKGIPCWHDDVCGAKRGADVAFTYDFGGFTVCHMGDFGEKFSAKRAADFGRPDVLLIPVGGTYTIDAKTAAEYVRTMNPKVAIPMHYRTESCVLDISPLEDFIRVVGRENVCGPVSCFDSEKISQYEGKILIMEVLTHE